MENTMIEMLREHLNTVHERWLPLSTTVHYSRLRTVLMRDEKLALLERLPAIDWRTRDGQCVDPSDSRVVYRGTPAKQLRHFLKRRGYMIGDADLSYIMAWQPLDTQVKFDLVAGPFEWEPGDFADEWSDFRTSGLAKYVERKGGLAIRLYESAYGKARAFVVPVKRDRLVVFSGLVDNDAGLRIYPEEVMGQVIATLIGGHVQPGRVAAFFAHDDFAAYVQPVDAPLMEWVNLNA